MNAVCPLFYFLSNGVSTLISTKEDGGKWKNTVSLHIYSMFQAKTKWTKDIFLDLISQLCVPVGHETLIILLL